jgi:hypothetical protein
MIVIPMAGMSRRFSEAGYTVPKYMLQAHGRSLFAHCVSSFEAYFQSEPFLFIVRDIADTPRFVNAECSSLGITSAQIVILEAPTDGQAETVALGLRRASVDPATPITIFNIDTIRPEFRHADFGNLKTDGYLEVFRGGGDNWSYVRPATADGNQVIETAEKSPISDLCSTGLYHFRTCALYMTAYEHFYRDFGQNSLLREHYVAPIYNSLIALGFLIRYTLVKPSQMILCGVPAEYETFLRAVRE